MQKKIKESIFKMVKKPRASVDGLGGIRSTKKHAAKKDEIVKKIEDAMMSKLK
jgi:hypothetical protein